MSDEPDSTLRYLAGNMPPTQLLPQERQALRNAAAELTRLRAKLAGCWSAATDAELVEIGAEAAYRVILEMHNPFGKSWGEMTNNERREPEYLARAVLSAIGPRVRAAALEEAAKLIEGGKEYDGADLTGTTERLQYVREWMRNRQRDALAAAIRKLGPTIPAGADDAG